MNKTLHSKFLRTQSPLFKCFDCSIVDCDVCLFAENNNATRDMLQIWQIIEQKNIQQKYVYGKRSACDSINVLRPHYIKCPWKHAIINKHCHRRSLQKLLYWCNVLLGPVRACSCPINYIIFKYKMCTLPGWPHLVSMRPTIRCNVIIITKTLHLCRYIILYYICFHRAAQWEIPSERLVLALLELRIFHIFSVIINEHHCNENDAFMRCTRRQRHNCVIIFAYFCTQNLWMRSIHKKIRIITQSGG